MFSAVKYAYNLAECKCKFSNSSSFSKNSLNPNTILRHGRLRLLTRHNCSITKFFYNIVICHVAQSSHIVDDQYMMTKLNAQNYIHS